MLEANKSRWFEKIFAVYNRNLLKRRFHSLRVSGLEFLRKKDEKIPLIIYANHSAWWDGLVAFQISQAAALDSFVMMEEKQLRKLFLFRLLGAFSVVREKPRQAAESINYAAKLLKNNPERTLWIFPQGEILPNDSRPVSFYKGLSRIIEKVEKCSATSLAIRYEFLGEFKPEIFVKIGMPEIISTNSDFDAKKLTSELENQLTKILDDLKEDVLYQNSGNYKNLLS
jgi:chlorobactene lauroyltransferase